MPEDKIGYQLSGFEKLEIARGEIEDLEKEFKETETDLRGIQFEVERLRFLVGVAKNYATSDPPKGYGDIEALEAKRVDIAAKLAALKAILPQVEAEAMRTGAPAAAPPASAPAPKAAGGAPSKSFESFDSFRKRQE